MRRHYTVILGICALCLVVQVAFIVKSTGWLQLGFLISLLLMLGALIESVSFAIKNWSAKGFKALTLFAVCAAVLPVSVTLGKVGRNLYFENILLPSFEKTISSIDRLAITRTEPPAILKSDHAYVVWAEITPQDILHVIFLTGYGFPVKHSGYLFTEGEEFDESAFIVQEWRIRKIGESWYRIVD